MHLHLPATQLNGRLSRCIIKIIILLLPHHHFLDRSVAMDHKVDYLMLVLSRSLDLPPFMEVRRLLLLSRFLHRQQEWVPLYLISHMYLNRQFFLRLFLLMLNVPHPNSNLSDQTNHNITNNLNQHLLLNIHLPLNYQNESNLPSAPTHNPQLIT